MDRLNAISLGKWAARELDKKFRDVSTRGSHHYAPIRSDESTANVLVCSRDVGKTVFEAKRVIFAHVLMTPSREDIQGMTGLICRLGDDTATDWALKLRKALEEIELDPTLLDKLQSKFEMIVLRRPSDVKKPEDAQPPVNANPSWVQRRSHRAH
jgi:hypothetical protein